MADAANAGRRWKRAVALLLMLLAAVVGAAWLAAGAVPAWWTRAGAGVGTAQAAEALENAVVSQLTMVRETDPALPAGGPWRSAEWAVSIKESDAAAWLTHRMPRWVENRWPERAAEAVRRSPRIEFAEGEVRIGVRDDASRVVWASCVPRVGGDGSVWLEAASAAVGRVPVRQSWVGRAASAEVADVLAGRRALLPAGAMELEDGRRVRLVGLLVRDGRLEVRAVTERP